AMQGYATKSITLLLQQSLLGANRLLLRNRSIHCFILRRYKCVLLASQLYFTALIQKTMLRVRRAVASFLQQQVSQAAALESTREGLPTACQLPSCCAQSFRCAASSSTRPTGPRPDASKQAAAAAAAAASSSSASSSNETPLSLLARQQQSLASMPLYPKMLGFAGALPFMTLTPAFVEAAGFPHLVDYCSQMQLAYGGSIVSFLGAVHWGMAMNSATVAAAGSKAAAALNERYVWSVVPALGVVPALMMQPAQGSFAVAVLLGICYLSDASYYRSGHLPAWFMSLRGYCTLLAMAGMLSTTAYYFKKDVAKARKMMEEEDAQRLA
ncbi:hypothetical protein Agub_g5204, partial [Astrephomene gubernaculifera]